MSDSAGTKIRVLVADFDLMSGTGGGQAVYRRLMEMTPDVEFAYFRQIEKETVLCPSNVRTIACGPQANANHLANAENEQWIHSFVASEQLADAVGPQTFDVLEIPDYRPWYLMLPPALERRGIKIHRTVVALHGQNSKSLFTSWDVSPRVRRNAELTEVLEHLVYRSADARYGISRSNIEDWKSVSSQRTDYLSPLGIVEHPHPTKLPSNGERPNLYFIGRTERRKGPDLFLEMLWNLPRSAYANAYIVGSAVDGNWGRDSNALLREMAQDRDLDVIFLDSMSQPQLKEVFSSRSIVFAPSRYDTLNLVALESLLVGCPAVIGEGAGVCRLLDEELPSIPYVRFDLKDSLLNARRTSELLANYDAHREQLLRRVSEGLSRPSVSSKLLDAYRGQSDFDIDARQQIRDRYQEQLNAVQSRSQVGPIRRVVRAARNRVNARSIADRLRRNKMTWAVACYQLRQLARITQLDESTAESRREKIAQLEQYVGGERFGRVAVWGMLSKLETAAGRDLVAATYALRTMRLAGNASAALMRETTDTLRRHKFSQESDLVNLMYGPSAPEQRHVNLLKWLHDHKARCTNNPTTEFVRVDDRRGTATARVAIIVSLYKAASKITHFLNAIQRQTMVQRGEVELILVDSGSPDDEYSPIAAHPCFQETPSLYVRTGNRETIQQAWNRGLALAKAPYVCMLGADETILPECLDKLATELDRRPDLDWIQANSLVTETDPEGNFERDVMLYDRKGYRPELVRLETCYLSWVGALYRRNIHERLGYYDPTFGAAGDTEFKNRLLPFIQTDAYLKTLGVFWNYPEIRTTQHPRAEIEDYRAWHVYRTSAGVEYAHSQSTPEQIVQAAGDALGYRRSYAHSQSADLEYACELLHYAIRRDPTSFPASLMSQLDRMLADFRLLDLAPWTNMVSASWECRAIFARMRQLNRELVDLFPNRPQLTYFNDERCEHINWCWSYLP